MKCIAVYFEIKKYNRVLAFSYKTQHSYQLDKKQAKTYFSRKLGQIFTLYHIIQAYKAPPSWN